MGFSETRIFDCEQGDAAGRKIAVIVSRYHKSLTTKLLDGALEALSEAGIPADHIVVAWVPGAWELTAAASRMLDDYDAVICLGAVIRGDTSHDRYINSMLSTTLGQLSARSGKPVAFGVLTCNTMEQAIARCGGNVGNKGEEAANAAIQMLQLFSQLD